MGTKRPKTSTKATGKPARRARAAIETPSVRDGLRELIARRAYEIYQRRIHQGALDDWLQAERDILGTKHTENSDRPHRGGYAAPEQE